MKAAGSLKIIDVRLGKAILYGRQNKFELTDENPLSESRDKKTDGGSRQDAEH